MKIALPFLLMLYVMIGCKSQSGEHAASTSGTAGEQIQQFLDANGIENEQTTSTGLVYIIEEPGGEEKPSINGNISIYYKGYLVDGTVFDQTRGNAANFGLYQLIPAWQEAIPLIGRGGKIKILAPPAIAYGNNPPRGSGITPSSVLVFDIELLDF